MIRLVLAIGLAVAVAINITAIAIQAPSFEHRWGPFPKPPPHWHTSISGLSSA